MKSQVIVNDHTAAAADFIHKLTNQHIEEYLDTAVALIKAPASPQPARDSDRRIVHNEVPTVPWQYDSGGVGRMDGNLADSYEWKKEGGGYSLFSQTGYGAYHEFGGAHTAPNPAGARAFAQAREQLLDSGPWA